MNKTGFFSDEDIKIKVELNKGRLKSPGNFTVALIGSLELREQGVTTVEDINLYMKKLQFNEEAEVTIKEVEINLRSL